MYDEKKLNAYWSRKESIKADWKKNGWDGSEKNKLGRDITFECGHTFFAGWGIKKLRNCPDCKFARGG